MNGSAAIPSGSHLLEASYGWQELAGSALFLAAVIVLFVLLRRAVRLVEKTVSSSSRTARDTTPESSHKGCNVSATSR